MDLDRLADLLADRVLAALNEMTDGPKAQSAPQGEKTACASSGFCTVDHDAEKPFLIGLTQDSDLPPCRFTLLESARVKEKYRIQCAQKCGYQVDLAGCEAVVLHDLTNESLAKIASGICDTPYTKLVSQALLMGKPIYLLQDQIELYNYRETAARPYYKMFRAQLGLLEQSGVMICCPDKIEDILVSGAANHAAVCPAGSGEKEIALTAHLISERSVADAHKNGATRIVADSKAIITDLAWEYAKKHGLALIRQ